MMTLFQYRALAKAARRIKPHLKPGAVLVSEHGFRYRVDAVEYGREVLVTIHRTDKRRAERFKVRLERLAERLEVCGG